MDLITPADVLEQAADLLERDGWCRGTFTNYQGHHCVRGAIRQIGVQLNDYVLANATQDILAEDLGLSHGGALVIWNDSGVTRRSQVTSRMRKVAKKLRGQK